MADVHARIAGSETVSFEVESFQQLPEDSGLVLLRLEGRWRTSRPAELDSPTLVIASGDEAQRLEPLGGDGVPPPRGGPRGRRWRAEFSSPADLVTGEAAFALEAGEHAIELPAPVEPPDEERDPQASRAWIGELERALVEARDREDSLQAELAGLREQLEQRDREAGVRKLEEQLAAETAARRELEERLATRPATTIPPPSRLRQPSWMPAEWVVAVVLLVFWVAIALLVTVGPLG